MRVKEFITELFDKQYSFTVKHTGTAYVIYEFKTDHGIVYEVEFHNTHNENEDYDVTFRNDRGIAISGEGDAFAIFSTVQKIIIHAIKNMKLTGIVFKAYLDEPSRRKLYNVMAKKLSNQLGWRLYTDSDNYILRARP